MAPATRAASNATVATDVSNGETGTPSPSTTPRRVPHCSKCKRPRVGHPRSGCPYVDSESGSAAPSPIHSPQRSVSPGETSDNFTATTPKRTGGRRSIGSNNIVTAMSSMYISGSSPSRETEEQIKAVIRDRTRRKSQQVASTLQPRGLHDAASLASLSTTSDEIVELLMQPGILDEDTEPEEEGNSPLKGRSSRVVQWQETIRVDTTSLKPALRKPKSSPQSPMPGTLITPNASFFESQSTVQDFKVKQEEGHGPRVLFTSPTPSFTSHKPGPRPLVRTMSSEQRQFFLSQLGRNSKAQIHVLARSTVHEIAEEAREMGFIAEVALNGDEESDEAFLVVGKDPVGVEKLVRRVAFVGQEVTASTASATPSAATSGGSNLRAVAGGAVVGAVGAWAGLAFS